LPTADQFSAAVDNPVAAMSDKEVAVTIEPDFLDFETVCKALGNLGKGQLWQLLHVGLVNGHQIGERTVFGWRNCGGSLSCAGAGSRENA
jgi:hypothetical protein